MLTVAESAKGAVIENSVVGLRCVIGENTVIRDSVLMGADFMETEEELAAAARQSLPPVGIGDGSEILGAILDKNCRIGKNVRIVNASGCDSSDEFDPCVIRDGIPILIKDSTLPDNWKMG